MNSGNVLKITESLVDDRFSYLVGFFLFVLFCFSVSGRRRKVVSVLYSVGSVGGHMFDIAVQVLCGTRRT